MNDANTDHYSGALLEDMNHKLDALMEGQQSLAHVPSDLTQLKDDVVEVKSDIKTIKLAIKDQTADHKSLVQRVTEHWNDK